MSGNGAPKVWTGRYLEDFEVGDIFRSRHGRTIGETDNVWITALTHNTNQSHFNHVFAERTHFARPLVNSTLTLALATGLSVPDTSENGFANLGWDEVRLPAPVFVGDTIWTETEVLAVRRSESRPATGIVEVKTRGVNQDGRTVIEFRRSFLIYSREAPEAKPYFPEPRASEGREKGPGSPD